MRILEKSISILLLITILISCSEKENSNQGNLNPLPQDKKPSTPSNTISNHLTASNQAESEDCIFDLNTQNDEFLKGIKEFNNYKWDNDSKTAEVVLSLEEKLIINRGGCDHYTYSIELISETDTTSFTNSDHWIKRIRKYYKLLPQFDQETIESVIENKGEPETQTDKFIFWASPSDLYCDGIEIIITKKENSNSIYIGYYQC